MIAADEQCSFLLTPIILYRITEVNIFFGIFYSNGEKESRNDS